MEILYDDARTVTAWTHVEMGTPPQNRPCGADRRAVELWRGPPHGAVRSLRKFSRPRGLSTPNPRIATSSIVLRARLIVGSPYLGMFLTSVLRRLIADHYAITALAVDLLGPSWSAAIVTVKNRTLSPVVERFLACVREVAAPFAGKPAGAERRARRRPMSLKGQTGATELRGRNGGTCFDCGRGRITARRLGLARRFGTKI